MFWLSLGPKLLEVAVGLFEILDIDTAFTHLPKSKKVQKPVVFEQVPSRLLFTLGQIIAKKLKLCNATF